MPALPSFHAQNSVTVIAFNLAAALTELRGFDGLLAGRRVHAVGRSVARSLKGHSWSFLLMVGFAFLALTPYG